MMVLIPENVRPEAVERLRARHEVSYHEGLWREPAGLAAALRTADGLLVRNQTQVTAELLAQVQRLKVIGRHGAGLDNIDVPAARARGIVVTSTPEENAVSVAEHTFALLLAAARHVPAADAAVRRGEWPRTALTGVELYGKSLGLLGLGRVGFRVATRARAFGMGVVAYDPFLSGSSPAVTEGGVDLVDSVDEVLARADVLSVHLPLTDATRGLLDGARLALLRPGAILVNTSRGGVIDEAALAAALRSGHLAAAALDVRDVEPPAADDPLLGLDNVVLTPHIAAFTEEAGRRVGLVVAEDILRVLDGRPARYAVP